MQGETSARRRSSIASGLMAPALDFQRDSPIAKLISP